MIHLKKWIRTHQSPIQGLVKKKLLSKTHALGKKKRRKRLISTPSSSQTRKTPPIKFTNTSKLPGKIKISRINMMNLEPTSLLSQIICSKIALPIIEIFLCNISTTCKESDWISATSMPCSLFTSFSSKLTCKDSSMVNDYLLYILSALFLGE